MNRFEAWLNNYDNDERYDSLMDWLTAMDRDQLLAIHHLLKEMFGINPRNDLEMDELARDLEDIEVWT